MRIAFMAASLFAALLGGCSTVKKTEIINNEIARVPVTELHGLSYAELQARLRLAPLSKLPVVEAELKGEGVITRIAGYRMTKDTPCPRSVARPTLTLEQDGKGISPPEFGFVDGRLSEVTHWGPARESVPGLREIAVNCSERKATSNDQARDVIGMAVYGPVLLPFAAALSVTNMATANDISAPLSKLPLGGEPPGGLAAYVADLPKSAVLASHEGGRAQVDFYYHLKDEQRKNPRREGDASVHFADGRVVKLTANKECVLTEQRTFSCERGYP